MSRIDFQQVNKRYGPNLPLTIKDATLTIDSPLYVAGIEKSKPRKPPALGEHSDAILREAGYDDSAIAQLRGAGIVA